MAVIGAGVSGLSFVRRLLVRVLHSPEVVSAEGLEIDVFDKSRGIGGRCATRRQTISASSASSVGSVAGEDRQDPLSLEVTFDHGAQYFTADSPQFQEFVEATRAQGQIEEWRAVIHVLDVLQGVSSLSPSSPEGGSNPRKRWVATPGQSQLAKSLWTECLRLSATTNVPIRLHTNRQIHTLDPSTPSERLKDGETRQEEGSPSWRLLGSDQTSLHDALFDQIVVAVPPSQAIDMLQTCVNQEARIASLGLEASKEIGDATKRIKDEASMMPSWALMLALDRPLSQVPFDGAFVHNSQSISWVAKNSRKPQRIPSGSSSSSSSALSSLPRSDRTEGVETWVVHSTAAWAKENLEITPEEAKARLLADFDDQITAAFGAKMGDAYKVLSATAHRWRFAINEKTLSETHLLLPLSRIALCGDFCGPRVEGAFLSGFHLASSLPLGAAHRPSASL